MTSIAWDGRYLAADSRGTFQGGSICRAPSHKLLATAHNAFAATGTISRAHLAALAAWYEAGEVQPFPIGEHVQGTFIAISPDGHAVCFTREQPYGEDVGTLVGFGSGSNWAEGAMDCGRDAMGAVAVAIQRDCNSGPPIQYIDVADLAAGVRRWAAFDHMTGTEMTARDDQVTMALADVECSTEAVAAERIDTWRQVRKPSKVAGASDWHADEWQTPECAGRLALGTGCGHCLRCNREWFVLLKNEYRITADPKVIEIPGSGVLVAAMGQLDLNEQTLHDALVELKSAPAGYGVSLTSIAHPGHPPGPLGGDDRQVLYDLVNMWNNASAAHDRTAQQNIDRAFREFSFPPGVEMVTDQPTPEFNHFRRRLIWPGEGTDA